MSAEHQDSGIYLDVKDITGSCFSGYVRLISRQVALHAPLRSSSSVSVRLKASESSCWKCCLIGSGTPIVCKVLLGGFIERMLLAAHSTPVSSCSITNHMIGVIQNMVNTSS